MHYSIAEDKVSKENGRKKEDGEEKGHGEEG